MGLWNVSKRAPTSECEIVPGMKRVKAASYPICSSPFLDNSRKKCAVGRGEFRAHLRIRRAYALQSKAPCTPGVKHCAPGAGVVDEAPPWDDGADAMHLFAAVG